MARRKCGVHTGVGRLEEIFGTSLSTGGEEEGGWTAIRREKANPPRPNYTTQEKYRGGVLKSRSKGRKEDQSHPIPGQTGKKRLTGKKVKMTADISTIRSFGCALRPKRREN